MREPIRIRMNKDLNNFIRLGFFVDFEGKIQFILHFIAKLTVCFKALELFKLFRGLTLKKKDAECGGDREKGFLIPLSPRTK
jgi:hypothetical protein